jgi:ATP-dependent DNA ligase
MKYSEFKYIYPPRPALKAPRTTISKFEELGFIAQPKLNGSCGVLFTDGQKVIFMNRHKSPFSKYSIPQEELRNLHRGEGWMVLVGEHMNKGQKDGKKKLFNGKFVIFDILVYNGNHLVGTTFSERQELLNSLYETQPFDPWISQISNSVYRANNVENPEQNWSPLTETGMYEGYVFKKKDGKLDYGFNSGNNSGWQVKIRKPTKNYSY